MVEYFIRKIIGGGVTGGNHRPATDKPELTTHFLVLYKGQSREPEYLSFMDSFPLSTGKYFDFEHTQ